MARTIKEIDAEISVLNSSIKGLDNKITRCKGLQTNLNSIIEYIDTIVLKLDSILSCLSIGLIVDSKPVGVDPIEDRKKALIDYKNNIINNCKPAVDNKINELNIEIEEKKADISAREKEKQSLWVKLVSVFDGFTSSK